MVWVNVDGSLWSSDPNAVKSDVCNLVLYILNLVAKQSVQVTKVLRLAQVLIVNSPWLFYGCWALIKPWIDPDFVERVCDLFCH